MQQLKRTIIRLCLGMVLLLGASGLAGTDVKAETWGTDSTNNTVRFTMQSQDNTHYQASFTEVYAGQKIESLVITGAPNPTKFESAFQQNSAQSGYEEYTSVTGIWSNASGTFKMGKKYRYRLVLSALNGNTMESGMRLNVCENNMYTYDDRNYDQWTQDALHPNIFYSPVIECKIQNPWDTVATDQPGAVTKNDADNPCVDATKLIKDPVLLNAVKGMGKDSPINEDNSMYRYRAQQAVKSLSLTYNTDVGEDMLKGIEYFPYLRNLTIKVNKKTNIKSLNLSQNRYLVHVFIDDYVGGTDDSISLPSSLRTLQIYDSKTGKFNTSLLQMKKLYEFKGSNLTVVGEPGSDSELNFSGCNKLDILELTKSEGFYYLYVPTDGSLQTIDLDQSKDLRALSFDSMPYLHVNCSYCPNLSRITAKNVARIDYLFAACNDAITRLDISGSVIGKADDPGTVSANYNAKLNTFLAKGTTFENGSSLEMHDDGFTGLSMQNPSSCTPIFKEGTSLKLYNNPNMKLLTLPATVDGCTMELIDCCSCGIVQLDTGSVKPATRSFKCFGNKLTGTLKISGILAAGEKWSMDCSGNASLTGLDTTGIGTLKSLDVSGTGIESLTLETVPANLTLKCDNCESLSKLAVKNGSVYSISATGVKALKNVILTNATARSIVLSDSLVLQQPSFTNASVDSLSIKQCSTPESLTIGSDTGIGNLQINKCSNLKTLDVSGASGLSSLDCSNNTTLENLNTGDNLSLKNLTCNYCSSLDSIDVSKNIALTSMNCRSSSEYGIVPISALDLSRNVNLETLVLEGCTLSALDLSGNKKLKKLDVDATGIKKLELMENPLLTSLECENCELASLDLSQNRKLTTLKCAGNHLVALDLTGLSLNTKSIRGQTRDVTSLGQYLDFEALDSSMDIGRVTNVTARDEDDNEVASAKQDTGYKFLSGTKTIDYWYDTDSGISGDSKLMSVTMTITETRAIPMVFFDACGGSVTPESAQINATTHTVQLPIPVRTDYDFEGWYASKDYAENTKVDDTHRYSRDARLFAKWTYNPPVIPEYMIRVNATEGGTVTGGNASYKQGELVLLTAIPDKGFAFDHWQKDGVDIEGNGTISVVAEADVSYVAVFRQDWVKCTITVDAAEGGSAKGGCTCIAGATVKMEAEAFEGYAFEKWQRFGIDTDKPASFELIAEGDEAWTAVFTKTGTGPVIPSYTVRIFASEGGTAFGAGAFMENSNITVQAVADSGYEFAGWYDEEGELLEEKADYTFQVQNDCDLIASFKKKPIAEDPKEDPKKEEPKKDDPGTKDPATNDPKTADPGGQQTPQGGNKINDNSEPGVGTFSEDGKTLTDPNGVTFAVAEKLTTKELKKGVLVADQKTGGKYRITTIVFKKGKFKSGTAEYVGPYNLDTDKINIPAKTTIDGNSFKVTGVAGKVTKGCTKVTKLVIGANVTKIAKNAFNGCSTLKTIQIKSKKLTKVGKKAFGGIHKKASVKVPGKKKKAYKKLLQKGGLAKTAKVK